MRRQGSRKSLYITLFLLILNIISPSVHADFYSNSDDFLPYVGINYKNTWVKPKGDWQKIFINSYPGFGFFLGFRLLPLFGIEAGYDWTANKPKVFEVGSRSVFVGLNNNETPVFVTGKTRFKNAHIDLNGFFPFCLTDSLRPEGIVSFGMARVKTGVRISVSPNTGPLNYIMSKENKHNAVFRIGLGAQGLIIENIGFRMQWRWENYSTIKSFRDANSLTTAIYLQF